MKNKKLVEAIIQYFNSQKFSDTKNWDKVGEHVDEIIESNKIQSKMSPKEFLEKQGFSEFVHPPKQEPFSPTFQWITVIQLLEDYASQLKFEQSSDTNNLQTKDTTKIRPIRFYCQKCGKELFEGIDLDNYKADTIEDFLCSLKECDDCRLKSLKQ